MVEKYQRGNNKPNNIEAKKIFINFGFPRAKLLRRFRKIAQGLTKSAKFTRRLPTISKDDPNPSNPSKDVLKSSKDFQT